MTEPALGGQSGDAATSRTAGCCCGGLKVRLGGDARGVYGCSCTQCQRASGSIFTYTALFPLDAVLSIEGEHRSWRRTGESGGWIERHFCPQCGSPVFGYAEGLPGVIQIAVGCLADPDFAPPGRLYWSQHRHGWTAWPQATRLVVGQ